MSTGDDGEVVKHLLAIRGDIGKLQGTVDAFDDKLTTHIEEDAAREIRLRGLELGSASARGASRVRDRLWNAGAALFGVIAGTFGSYWLRHR